MKAFVIENYGIFFKLFPYEPQMRGNVMNNAEYFPVQLPTFANSAKCVEMLPLQETSKTKERKTLTNKMKLNETMKEN
ncbi:hypothetical protein T12_7257 [Trichinella patagoniensis]|uniref:Uncharacterized protein n=1 Tax=Trichinella patagoniensis TaxID=990121 RepID=A0A0V0Z720_9BILA|nr:hypothetical protein T12_7257 [Trichinella patagoniensis]